jgi:hypothetical protein
MVQIWIPEIFFGVRSGSFATGWGEQHVRPCPLLALYSAMRLSTFVSHEAPFDILHSVVI